MKRAVGYIRVSTQTQVERGYSLGEQEAMLQRHAEARGYQIVEFVQDAGESGRLEHRPGLKRILELARTRTADVVIVTVIDRVGRAARIILETLHRIRECGVSVEYTDLQIDTSTAEGRLQEGVHAVLAEYQWERLRSEMLKGKRGKLAKERLPSNWRCFGYRMVTVAEARAIPERYADRDGTAEIIPEQAAIVRQMFERYASGELSLRGVARWLNGDGVLTAYGKRWEQTGVRLVLANPAYKGAVIWGQFYSTRREDPESGRKIRVDTPRPESEWKYIPVPPIVDPALWARVQEQLRINQQVRSGRPAAQVYALAGVLFCEHCRGQDGAPLRVSPDTRRGRRDSRYRYYTCSSKAIVTREFCRTTAPAGVLEAEVYKQALRALRPGRLGKAARERLEAEQRDLKGLRAELTRLEKSLSELRAQGQRLADAVARGVLSLEDAEPQSRRIQSERVAAQQRAREITGALSRAEDPAELEARVEAQAAEWRAELLANRDNPAALRPRYAAFLRVFLNCEKKVRVEIWTG